MNCSVGVIPNVSWASEATAGSHSINSHQRETNFTNTAACVHMSLNNSGINIQCFHYRRRRRARRLGRSVGRGRRSNGALRIISREERRTGIFSSAFSLTDAAACLIHECKQNEIKGLICLFSYITFFRFL